MKPPAASLTKLIARYRTDLRRLVAERREISARIAARREVLRDLLAARGDRRQEEPDPPPRRGRITQAEAVRRVLAEGAALTAAEIYAAALEAGAGGTERSLRNVLSRRVRDGALTVDRRTFPQRYRSGQADGG